MKPNLLRTRFSAAALALVFLVVPPLGCSESLHAPTANVTLDGTVVPVGGRVVLDGSTSTDPNGEPLAYLWRVSSAPAGSHAAIADEAASRTWLMPDVSGEYTVELVVSDGALTSAPATATFTAGPCGDHAPVVGSITFAPADPAAGDAVALAATAGDADLDPACGKGEHLTFAWSIEDEPPGSRAALNDPTLERPSLLTDLPGSYRVRLVVTDAAGHESPALDTTVSASGCITPPGDVTGVSASPSTAGVGELVTLSATVQPRVGTGQSTTGADAGAQPSDGTGADGGALPPPELTGEGPAAPVLCQDPRYGYHWTLVAAPPGSSAVLSDPELESPSFVGDLPGEYSVALYVTGPDGTASESARVTFQIGDCGSHTPTLADLTASPASPSAGQAVSLSATVSDADTAAPCARTEHFAYRWSIASAPAGSQASLDDPGREEPSFIPDLPGTYEVSLRVVDSEGHVSGSSSVTVDANDCGGNAPALGAMTASPASPDTFEPVSLGVAVTDADTQSPCRLTESFTLSWGLQSVPAGSRAVLSSTSGTAPWFTPDLPGDYVAVVRATDAAGHVSPPKTLKVTARTCGSQSPSISSVDAAPATPHVGDGVSLSATVTDADTGGTCRLAESFSYAWALTSAPAGSVAVLTSATSPSTGFVPDRTGSYGVSLVVTDPEGHASAVATKSVTVAAASTCGTAVPVAGLAAFTAGPCTGTCTAATISPTLAAGPSATAPGFTIQLNGHGSVRLDGSRSSDADNNAPCSAGQPLSYQWSLLVAPLGSQAAWSIGSGPTTTLVAPTFVPDLPGVYQVALTVSDGVNTSKPLVVQIER